MFRYKVMKQKDIKLNDLSGYIRDQHTTRMKYVLYNEDLTYKTKEILEKETDFEDHWDSDKLVENAKELKEINGSIVYVYDRNTVIGFASLDYRLYNDAMNMPFIHVSKPYRGKGLAKELFYMISDEALKNGAKKLYISAHPNVDTYRFYEKVGCVLAEPVIKELYDHEPFDLQLEKELSHIDIMYRRVKDEFMKHPRLTAQVFSKVASKLYRKMPKSDKDYLDVCKHFITIKERGFFSVATLLLKRQSSLLTIEHIRFYENILYEHIRGWDEVDQFCYRVLNPVLNDPIHFSYLDKWSKSRNKDVRRASLVSMIKSSTKLTLDYDLDKVMILVERLKDDKDFHVIKAVGWVLKCAFVTYNKEIIKYLEDNYKTLNRIIFRYALEHSDKDTKTRLMNLR